MKKEKALYIGDVLEPKAKFSIGLILILALDILSMYSIISFLAGKVIYPFNFLFWINNGLTWGPVVALVILLFYPTLLFLLWYIFSFIVIWTSSLIKEEVYEDSPGIVKYRKNVNNKNYWVLANHNLEEFKVINPIIYYWNCDEVYLSITKFYFPSDKTPSKIQKLVTKSLLNRYFVTIFIPKEFKKHPKQFISFQRDKNESEPCECKVEYKIKQEV